MNVAGIGGDQPGSRWLSYGYLSAIIALFVLVYLKNAWVAEDGYIVFRSLEQLFAGNGPIWNPHERVQVFTSPLWYWLLAIPRLVSTDHFLNVILLSTLLIGLMLLFMQRILPQPLRLLIAVLLLVSCNGFMDYTSSGLENPLAYALLACFLYLYLRIFNDEGAGNRFQLLSLLAITFGLLIVTRHDLLLLVLPAMGYLLVRYWLQLSRRQWAVLFALSFTLFVGWSLFSLIYYGSIFPNTAYAKLNTGIPKAELVAQGLLYLNASLFKDSIFVVVWGAALLISLFSRAVYLRFIGAGLLLNLLYILYVGGDFMLGRFFSYGYLIAVLLLCAMNPAQLPGWLSNRAVPVAMIKSLPVLILLYAMLYPHTPFKASLDHVASNIEQGIADERGFYFKSNSLYAYWRYRQQDSATRANYFPLHEWAKSGWQVRDAQAMVVQAGAIGMVGYWSGNHHTIVDPLALSDPFLARLPIIKNRPWRIGHFVRALPEGYLQTLQQGRVVITDPALAELYRVIALISQSPELFSGERLKAIIKMNLGGYDHLVAHLR